MKLKLCEHYMQTNLNIFSIMPVIFIVFRPRHKCAVLTVLIYCVGLCVVAYSRNIKMKIKY